MTNYYVKTEGDNANDGLSWATAWKTVGYAFQTAPASSVVYVEEGLYGSEILANINPANPPISMMIQPNSHTNNPCIVWVCDKDSFTVNIASPNDFSLSTNTFTFIQAIPSIPYTGKLKSFDFRPFYNATFDGYFKLKVFRDDGTNFVFIGESDYIHTTVSGNIVDFNQIGISVQANDLIGIKSYGTNAKIAAISATNQQYYKSGDITSTTLKSSWSSTTGILALKAQGFKAI